MIEEQVKLPNILIRTLNRVKAFIREKRKDWGQKVDPREVFIEKLQDVRTILHSIDASLRKSNVPQKDIRDFWADFYKFGAFRDELFEELIKDDDIDKIISKYVKTDYLRKRGYFKSKKKVA